MNLDRDFLPHCTIAARAALVNAPEWSDGLTFAGFPGDVPAPLLGWVAGTAGVAGERKDPRGVVLYGPAGTGKTGLAVCVLRDLAAVGFGDTLLWNLATAPGVRAAVLSGDDPEEPSPCWFERFSRLLALRRREQWDEAGWFEQLEQRVSALVLDDVGVDAGTPYRESFLLQHVEWAQDRRGRALVITLNPPPAKWEEVLGERIADRLLDPRWFLKVQLGGASLR
jgi:hypothetical protein